MTEGAETHTAYQLTIETWADGDDIHTKVGNLQTQIMKTQDAQIQAQLIKLGWTPPGAAAPDLKAALEGTRRLVGKCVESGFADDDDIRALFVNNGKITDALARAGGQ